MAIWQGTYFEQIFTLVYCETEAPVNVSGWELRSQLRDEREDEEVLLELTTANGGWAVLDGPAGQIVMMIQAEQSKDLPLEVIEFDVLRTDVVPGPVLLFWGKVPVKLPVTRDG